MDKKILLGFLTTLGIIAIILAALFKTSSINNNPIRSFDDDDWDRIGMSSINWR